VRTQPNVFYIGAVNGGVWGDDGLRPDVDANLRRPADRLNRRRTAGRADTLLAQWTALKAEAARLNLARCSITVRLKPDTTDNSGPRSR